MMHFNGKESYKEEMQVKKTRLVVDETFARKWLTGNRIGEQK
jgi:hypothetical protein